MWKKIKIMTEIYTDKTIELIRAIDKNEKGNIDKAAEIVYNAMRNKGLLHVFCTGHSHMMAEELFYRAGGLVQVNPVLEPILMQHEGAVRSTKLERLSGLAKILFDSIDVRAGEPFLIASNSGINAVPIEMAKCAKEKGCPVIVVTSKVCSDCPNERNKDGKYLYQFADVVINNHVPLGDGLIESKFGRIGAGSTIACSYIAQRLVVKIIDLYEKDGIEPQIYQSANIKGGDEHNEEILREFAPRIRCLY